MRQLLRVGGAVGTLRTEDLDHADDGAEQTQQRCRRGDGAQCIEVALGAVHGLAARVLDRLAQRVLADARLGDHAAQAGGQHVTQRGVLGQLAHHVGRRQAGAGDAQHLVQQAGRGHAHPTQLIQALEDQGERDDGAGDEQPDRPAGGLYDGEQGSGSEMLRRTQTIMDDAPPRLTRCLRA